MSTELDLYACQYCLRLRGSIKFADPILKKSKIRDHKDAGKRFCIECGMNPPAGSTGYAPGNEINAGDVTSVLCLYWRSFKPIGIDLDGKKCRACVDC